MRQGRPPLTLGTHGNITTRTVGSGRTCARARLRLWDGEVHRITATAETESAARALLEVRIAERLRLSELNAWRYLTAYDPFDGLVYLWLGDLEWSSEVSGTTCARCKRIVLTQLTPEFGDLTIGEISAERIEQHLDTQRATSEAASRDLIKLLLDFAVGEGVLIANPMEAVSGAGAPSWLADLAAYRRLVRERIELRRGEQLREVGRADG